jgi:glucans biosynthesis protein
MIRREFLAGLAALSAMPAGAAPLTGAGEGVPFHPDMIREMARLRAASDYVLRPEVPQEWINLSYDDFGHIWFAERNAIWNGTDSALRVDPFTAGLFNPRAVALNLVEDGVARAVPYDRAAFDATDNFPDLPVTPDMGYAGFRLRAELERGGIFTECAVFQGASYFRAIGTGQTYGLSARGIAVDTAEPTGEEFPEFIAHWIERPGPHERTFTVHSLMDGPRIAGAYTFRIHPGLPLRMDVTAHLFPRTSLAHVGIAPLTSMFLFDETNRGRFDDFRPAVHDNDGLLIWNGADEMLWRPLANPAQVQVSSFADKDPRGFGLMQRTRDFDDFADMVAHYERRPSLWVEPGEDWGQGAVTLVEIPTDQEVNDNIVAYWRPTEPFAAGSEHRLTYSLSWGGEPDLPRALARVANTRIGAALTQGRVVTVDFAPQRVPPGTAAPMPELTLSAGKLLGAAVLQTNPTTGGLRLAFTFDPEGAEQIEMRAVLRIGPQPFSEIWMYRWTA